LDQLKDRGFKFVARYRAIYQPQSTAVAAAFGASGGNSDSALRRCAVVDEKLIRGQRLEQVRSGYVLTVVSVNR